jgi:methylated-DNA-[protein]-cysteine S-methyltransferase
MTADLTRQLHEGPPIDHTADLLAAAFDRADAEGLVEVAWARVDTPVGPLTVAATADGLVRVAFGHEDEVLDHLAEDISPRVAPLARLTDPARRQLDEYFEGERHRFDLPLDWRLSRGFRRQVLERLFGEVDYGQTVTYKDLAVATGSPGASRAVGSAMATNPIAIVVPCHRVLRTGGNLGGYGGGLPVKEWLLSHEGAPVAPPKLSFGDESG